MLTVACLKNRFHINKSTGGRFLSQTESIHNFERQLCLRIYLNLQLQLRTLLRGSDTKSVSRKLRKKTVLVLKLELRAIKAVCGRCYLSGLPRCKNLRTNVIGFPEMSQCEQWSLVLAIHCILTLILYKTYFSYGRKIESLMCS